jgi:hypothetical protein
MPAGTPEPISRGLRAWKREKKQACSHIIIILNHADLLRVPTSCAVPSAECAVHADHPLIVPLLVVTSLITKTKLDYQNR